MSIGRPQIRYEKKVCIICEGYEEYDYIETLCNLNVWNDKYKIDLVNAESNGNIAARYQEKYMSDSYDLVLIFCDTDKLPYEDYNVIKQKINRFHGNSKSAEKVFIYGNPCTMQIILMHFDDIKLTSHKKNKNATEIKRLTEIEQYGAHKHQREQLCNLIDKENYELMKQRIRKIPSNDNCVSSSNFDFFADCLEETNYQWIDDINKVLEETD